MTTHRCPPGGAILTPCCSKTPWELPRDDRLTAYADLVDCGAILHPDLEALRQLARQTGEDGPWEFGCGLAEWAVTTEGDDCHTIATTPDGSVGEYIAAISPGVLIPLLDELARLRIRDAQH
jgi:hypothetical protein